MPERFSWAQLSVDPARIRECNEASLPQARREFVLYWCMTSHRAQQNHGLEAAISLANHLDLPVVCYQALRPDYPHASDRIHGFVLEGLAELTAALGKRGIPHWVELPRTQAQHRPRLGELGKRAAAVVTDFVPTFVVPGHLSGAAKVLSVPLWAVDSACSVPMQRIAEAQVGAYALRPKVRKLWPEYLKGPLPEQKLRHADLALKPGFDVEKELEGIEERLHEFDIDHSVRRVPERRGGRKAALQALKRFVQTALPSYGEGRNNPGTERTSWLSPYFHFGHLFPTEAALAAKEALGAAHPSVESFCEELLVRRELGFNFCLHTPQKQQLSVSRLPNWAQLTADAHEKDKRDALYSTPQLEDAKTGDEIWNAAQRQLTREGRIHGYLRMLWGKRILGWSRSNAHALKTVAYLNDKYALDGRDPASVANFMWLFGLHDRPFPERPVFGKVRTMSSARTAEKFDLTSYLRSYAAHG